MSRLGHKPVVIADKVKIALQGNTLNVEGPLGKLSQDLPKGIGVKIEDKEILITRTDDSNQQRALHGTVRKLVINMIEGVSKGFKKQLQIVGVGFRAQLSGDKLSMVLGYSHPIDYQVPKGVKLTVDKKQTIIDVEGADKQLVGQVSAEIRDFKRPEPYKGTGIQYTGEQIRRKAGKAATGGGGGGKK